MIPGAARADDADAAARIRPREARRTNMSAVVRCAPMGPARARRVPGAARVGGAGRVPVGAEFPARHEAIDRNAVVAAVADAALADDINQSACALGRRVVARSARWSDGPGARRRAHRARGDRRFGENGGKENRTRATSYAHARDDVARIGAELDIACCQRDVLLRVR